MRWLFFLAVLLASYPVAAQVRKHPIDVAHDKCLAKGDAEGDSGPGTYRGCDGDALKSWESEMARLLKKLPNQNEAQATWVRQRNSHVTAMKRDFMKSADITSEVDLPMTVFDEVHWYQISATRKRVLALTKLAHGQPFSLPKE